MIKGQRYRLKIRPEPFSIWSAPTVVEPIIIEGYYNGDESYRDERDKSDTFEFKITFNRHCERFIQILVSSIISIEKVGKNFYHNVQLIGNEYDIKSRIDFYMFMSEEIDRGKAFYFPESISDHIIYL